MTKLLSIGIAFASVAAVSSCTSDFSNGPRTSMVQKNEDLFRERAMEFIRSAQKGNVESMMRFTSQQTLKNSGADHVRVVYSEQVVPAFRGAMIAWNKNGTLCRDEFDNTGFTFSGTAQTHTTKPFYIDVFGENGELMIMNIRSTPRQ